MSPGGREGKGEKISWCRERRRLSMEVEENRSSRLSALAIWVRAILLKLRISHFKSTYWIPDPEALLRLKSPH